MFSLCLRDPLRQGRREEIDIVLAVNNKGVHLWAEIVRVLFSSITQGV